ncbi:hypothetical protein GHT89_16560 [Acinetobacter baumannii]|uniref:hypothetical protein n=1 Tax=Acinetobacter baumannii TaxID=470 RepID=UPI00387DBF12
MIGHVTFIVSIVFFIVSMVISFFIIYRILNNLLLDKCHTYNMKKYAIGFDYIKNRVETYARPTSVGYFVNYEDFDESAGKEQEKNMVTVTAAINDLHNIADKHNYFTVDFRDQENIKLFGYLIAYNSENKRKEYSIYLTEM